MANAVIVVPPLLKYTAGPLLGPALLAGAARQAGHEVSVIDWNAQFLRAQGGMAGPTGRSRWVGDHDRPAELLRSIEESFRADLELRLGPGPVTALPGIDDPVLQLASSFAAVERAATSLADASTAGEVDRLLPSDRPDMFCVSVLWSGQVVHGLAATMLARRRWPGIPILWGGPHVTALREEIVRHPAYGRFVDRFVFGYAEGTFVDALQSASSGSPGPEACIAAGEGTTATRSRELPFLAPAFGALELYDAARLTLPVQASRGCSYGACTYCTYPAIEGEARSLDPGGVGVTVQLAQTIGASVAFKDSLMSPELMTRMAGLVGGRTTFSMCTKLDPRLDRSFLLSMAGAGLRTLEVGAETFDPDAQRLIRKRQRLDDLRGLAAAADAAGVGLVVNYMAGLPHQDGLVHAEWLQRTRATLGQGRAKLHVSQFQLERLSPLARRPGEAEIEVLADFPWSSVLAWRAVTPQGRLARRLQVVR